MKPNQESAQGFTAADEDATISNVMRGLLHDLANLATALDGASAGLEHDGSGAMPRVAGDLRRTTERLFALHTQMRSLLPDHGGAEALDPRAIAEEVAALLAWHTTRSCAVLLAPGAAAPILGEPWRVRRQLLSACDRAAGASGDLSFSFRVSADLVAAVRDDGLVFWSSPTLSAARLRERPAG